MITICKQNLGVAPWRQKFSRLKDLFIMMFSMLWYSRGKKEFAESIWYLWGIFCCNIVLFIVDLRIKTAFNLVKIHLLFRIMLSLQWLWKHKYFFFFCRPCCYYFYENLKTYIIAHLFLRIYADIHCWRTNENLCRKLNP